MSGCQEAVVSAALRAVVGDRWMTEVYGAGIFRSAISVTDPLTGGEVSCDGSTNPLLNYQAVQQALSQRGHCDMLND